MRAVVLYEHGGPEKLVYEPEYSNRGRAAAPGTGTYCYVPVHNRWGLRPAVVEGTKQMAPLTAVRDLDAARLLDNVTTFNFHPHLPHYELAAPGGRLSARAGSSTDRSQ